MSDGRRPGGLTALAVLNFVYSAYFSLGIFGLIVIMSGAVDGVDDEAIRTLKSQGQGWLLAHLLLLSVTMILLIASGVGYLKQRRFLGRTLGNACAVSLLVGTGVGLAYASFGIGTIASLVYPVLTLILLNTTFKDDLVR